MADAKAMLFSFSSNVPRLVYSLAYGIYGCLKPFASFEGNWCWRTWMSGSEYHTPMSDQLTAYKNEWNIFGSTEPGKEGMHLSLGRCLGNGNAQRETREDGSVGLVDGIISGQAGC